LKNLFAVRDAVVLITGSTRGLGRVFAEGFAAAGAKVIVNGRDGEHVAQCVGEIEQIGAEAYGAPFDVTDTDAASEAVGRIGREVGPIDVLVNNAGIHDRGPLGEMRIDQWRHVLDVNLTAVFIVSQLVAGGMIKKGGGRIVNVSSLNSVGARPTIANYCAAKAGLNALTRSMATEWGRHNVTANAIVPGYFVTDLTRELSEDADFDKWVRSEVPLGRWGDPEELVGTAIFLASAAASYINGQLIIVDGGWTACL
jgi:gluconate 5-dehydrogenase